MLDRSSVWSWVNPLRCSSPASVTWVRQQVQRLELGQPFEVFQPGVRDLRAPQVQRLELGQPFEVFQPGVRDLGCATVQRPELGQPFEVLQSGVRDLSAYKATEMTGLRGLVSSRVTLPPSF